MDFEFVEFYSWGFEKDKKNKNRIAGTAHVYAYSKDFEVDFRGILVYINKNKVYFSPPHKKSIDADTGANVSYPCFSFPNEDHRKKFVEFLKNDVEPIIRERLKLPAVKLEKS